MIGKLVARQQKDNWIQKCNSKQKFDIIFCQKETGSQPPNFGSFDHDAHLY